MLFNSSLVCLQLSDIEGGSLLIIRIAELGTSGSVDGSRRLVIKGRFQQKQIENVLRRYVGECKLSPRIP